MDKARHNEYIGMIQGFQEQIESVRLDDMELTEEEQQIVDGMPLHYREEIDHALEKYVPDYPEYDFRLAVMEKAYAVFMLQILPYISEAYEEGKAYG
jgi:flavodoxin